MGDDAPSLALKRTNTFYLPSKLGFEVRRQVDEPPLVVLRRACIQPQCARLELEGTDRRLHYILQTPDMERARGQARFRVGDHISLTGSALTREGRTMVTTEIQVEPAKARPTGRLTGRREPVPEPAALRTLAAVEREHGRPICVVAPSVEGLIYRGPLLGYAKDRDGHCHAILDTGRELSAFRTDAPAHAPGLEIRATSASVRDARGRQVLGWRLQDERQRQRERGRER